MATTSRSSLLVLAALASCAPAVQRADLSPVFIDVKAHAADFATSHPTRLVFRSPAARVHVLSSDLINGDHHLTFERVRGQLLVDRSTGRGHLRVDVAMRWFRAETAFITDFASGMLETDRYPHAVLDAKVEPVEGELGRRLVTGNMLLHGIERGIRFYADVVEHGEGLRLRAVFDMSRTAFGIHARADEGEGIIRDDFTVTFDFRATHEHVVVEDEVIER